MKLIPLRWLALVHYPSSVKYDLEQACLALENTMKALAQCAHMKSEMMFTGGEKVEKMLRIIDTMFTMLDTRQALLEVRISELRARQVLVNAFNVNVGDSMPALDDAIKHIDKVFADLSQEGVK